MSKLLRLVRDNLNEPSRSFYAQLEAAAPDVAGAAEMEPAPEGVGFSLVINLASPTGDADRRLGVWMDRGSEPSLGFGPSHTHAEVWASDGTYSGHSGSIIDLLMAILRDEVVILEEIGGEHPGHQDWLDLRDPCSIEDYFTRRYSAARIRLKSWSGRADREIAIQDLDE